MSTPFEAHRGALQQRVRSALAFEGSYAYELGHGAHLDVNLDAGDRHDVTQTFEVSAQSALARARVRIRAAPESTSWMFEVLLNGVVHYARSIAVASRLVVLTDVAVRLAGAVAPPGTNTITFRLRLV